MLTLEQCLRANRPLTFVTCESDIEVLRYLKDTFPKSNFYVYSTTFMKGVKLKDLLEKKFQAPDSGKVQSTFDFLDSVYNRTFKDATSIFDTYIFLDCDTYIKDPQNIRKIKDIVTRYQADTEYTVNMIFLSQNVCVPPLLERLSEVVYFDLPSEEKLKDLSEHMACKDQLDIKKPSDETVMNLKGLTLFEVEQAYAQSWQIHGDVNLEFIRNFKKSAIAKTDLLSLLESDVTFDDIGGMETLKNWIVKSYGGWTVEGKKYGLPMLKGLLMVGLPGCGKSLVAKALGNIWNGLPVISFDPGKVFSSRVGESEHNIRRVLKIVENIAPCLEGTSRITLADGQVASIKELYDNNFRGEVISINDTFDFDKSKVVLITKKQSNDLYNVRTGIGNIKATGNHKFPILKSNGELHWVRVDNLQPGDYIISPRKVKTFKQVSIFNYLSDDTRFYSEKLSKDFLEISKTSDYQYYLKNNRRVKNSKSVSKYDIIKFGLDTSDFSHVTKMARGGGGYQDSFVSKIPKELTEDFLYILGLLWSDGNIGDKGYWFFDSALKPAQKCDKYRAKNQNTTKFFNNELVLHDEIIKFFKENFDCDITLYETGTPCKITYGIPLIVSEILRKVQKDVLSLPEKLQWAWLSGVLDGDGHIHKERINYAAKKHLNNEYLRDVLLRVGVILNSQKDDFQNVNTEITSAKFIEQLENKLNLRHPKKFDHLGALISIKRDGEKKCRMDTIDVKEKLTNLLLSKDLIVSTEIETQGKNGITDRKKSVVFKSVSEEVGKQMHDYLDRDISIDIDKIKNIFESIGEGNQWFFKDCFYFTPVKEINKIQGVHDVYDLCLDKNHNFIANRMFTHNCVLLIDEIEKAFAGSQSSTFSDSGVTARVIGSFLNWLQDCTKPVFTIATSNNIQYLPPELIQRFDEKFFVNLPTELERVEIFRIHLKRVGRDPEKFDLEALSKESKDLSGREIEQTIREAMYDAFYVKKEIDTKVILNVLGKKTNLLTTMSEQLNYLLEWVGWSEEKNDGIRARFASVPDKMDMKRVKNEIESLCKDIEKKKPFEGFEGTDK